MPSVSDSAQLDLPNRNKDRWLTAFMLLISFGSLLGFLADRWENSGDDSLSSSSPPQHVSQTAISNTHLAPAAPRSAQPYLKPIQEVQLGERVLAKNPDQDKRPNYHVEPTVGMWRKVQLVMLQNEDDLVAIELLRPLQWFWDHDLAPKAVVDLDLPELGAKGPAVVVAIDSCPPIKTGDGHVVTGRFVHLGKNLIDVTIGDDEPIGCTASHPFWSEDRQDFVEAGKLNPGERLRSHDNRLVTLTSVVPRAGPEPVYNLEVNLEHVYHVGASGTLVHNMCTTGKPQFTELKLFRDVSALPANSIKVRQAKLGVAVPRGRALNSNSLGMHVLNESFPGAGVTSWTTRREIAVNRFSLNDGTVIEVFVKDILDKVVKRPNVNNDFGEFEVLLRGTIQGAPTRP